MITRNVVVVMPFGGKGRVERRKAILSFKRLEYLLHKCRVNPVGTGCMPSAGFVTYSVKPCGTATDEIPDRALRQICNADILVALIVEPNANVIYEVAFRQAKERKLILVVDSNEFLPLYLKSWVYHNWRQETVLARIQRIAEDDVPDLPDFNVDIPSDLRDVIEKNDSNLERGIEQALRDIEAEFEPEPGEAVVHLRKIFSEACSSFYPVSIVEVAFKGHGDFADPASPAVVREFDEGFVRLYDYAGRRAAEADCPLTTGKLLKRIEKFSDAGDWEEFMKDQFEMTMKVVKDYGFARANVPLKINNQHPRAEHRGTSYLPCIISQVIDGNLEGPHKMYLLVAYIELPKLLKL
jgi:hypothetical protein